MHSCEGLWSSDLPQPTVLKIFHVRLIKLEGHPGCCLRRLVRRDEEKLLQASHPPDRLLKNIKRSTKKEPCEAKDIDGQYEGRTRDLGVISTTL
jgi:hypothetical protein